ncbi:unnamed protein product, partial [Polarella glacialis]
MARSGYPTEADSWRVVHQRVIVRQAASTTAEILGFHAKDKVVEGVVTRVGQTEWLKVTHRDSQAQSMDGFMLIDGAGVGLGKLLERVPPSAASALPSPTTSTTTARTTPTTTTTKATKATATTTPTARTTSSPAAKSQDLGDLSRWFSHAGKDWASFVVVSPQVMVRNMPSTKAKMVGVLTKGDVVEGEPREGWVLLDRKSSSDLANGAGRWVLMDGKEVGLGPLLQRQVVMPQVKKEFANALEVRFPDGVDMSKHCLEVCPGHGREFSVQCPEGRSMLVHDLMSDTAVQLRFSLKDGDRVIASSDWISAETEYIAEWEELEGPGTDLMGQGRGRCTQCTCPCFALEEGSVSMNMDVSASCCGRCGCKVSAHSLWSEPARPAAQPVEASKKLPGPPPDPPMLQKAISLPKETMLRRWRPLDLQEGTEAWPLLPQSFTEVVAWSDLHSDMGKNMENLKKMPICKDTVLILAGDLASSLEVLEKSIRLLLGKFGAIFYVPGNHELWVNKKDGYSSIHKFLAILE